jgi:hypothetical protein
MSLVSVAVNDSSGAGIDLMEMKMERWKDGHCQLMVKSLELRR